jgi:hypothetical protein
MAVTEPAPQNVSSRKELLAIFYRYKLNFLCTTKSEDPKKYPVGFALLHPPLYIKEAALIVDTQTKVYQIADRPALGLRRPFVA